jgi:peroxiredoxin
LGDFKSKGVDVVAVIASNDAFVMNAWGKVNGVKGDGIVCVVLDYLMTMETEMTDGLLIALPQRY